MESGVPLIDIRTIRQWFETGVIKNSHLLTIFIKMGIIMLKNGCKTEKNSKQKRPYNYNV